MEWVRDAITDLCTVIKDEANGLIDAIALSDQMLGSPIGSQDGNVYNRFLGLIKTLPSTFEKPTYWKEIQSQKP